MQSDKRVLSLVVLSQPDDIISVCISFPSQLEEEEEEAPPRRIDERAFCMRRDHLLRDAGVFCQASGRLSCQG